MDRINSKLYLQNCFIIKENERLRKRAALLNRENKVLLSELKQRLTKTSQPHGPTKDAANNTAPSPLKDAANNKP